VLRFYLGRRLKFLLTLCLGLAFSDAEAEQTSQVGDGGLGLVLALEADVGESNGADPGLMVLRDGSKIKCLMANHELKLNCLGDESLRQAKDNGLDEVVAARNVPGKNSWQEIRGLTSFA
jgi:hypothetical protein